MLSLSCKGRLNILPKIFLAAGVSNLFFEEYTVVSEASGELKILVSIFLSFIFTIFFVS